MIQQFTAIGYNFEAMFRANPWAWYLFFIFIGATLGSFLGVVWSRYPTIYQNNLANQCLQFLDDLKHSLFLNKDYDIEHYYYQNQNTLSYPGSHCENCQNPIRWYHNIPILSFLILRGRCSYCGIKISPVLFFIESTVTAVFGLIAYKTGIQGSAFIWAFFWTLMIALFLVDLKSKWLPEIFMNCLIIGGLALELAHVHSLPTLHNGILAALGIYIFVTSIVFVFEKITKKEAMGGGDFQLFAIFGLWFGFQPILPLVLLSCIIGIIIGIMYLSKNPDNPQYPFGPSIITAGFIIWFFNINIHMLLS